VHDTHTKNNTTHKQAHWNNRNNNWRAFGAATRDGVPIPGRDVPTGAAAAGGPAGPHIQHAPPKPGMGMGAGAGRMPGAPGWVPSNAKSKMCKAWSLGTCSYGAKCTFAHGEHELVPLSMTR
jgi:hypothetical protein